MYETNAFFCAALMLSASIKIMGDLNPEVLFGHDGPYQSRYVPIHNTFLSLEDAQDAILHTHACIIADVLRGRAAHHVHNVHIASWTRAFETFLHRPRNIRDQVALERMVAVLELMKRHIGVVLLGWDAQEKEYREMVALAKRALGLDTTTSSLSDKGSDGNGEEASTTHFQTLETEFEFNLGVVPALYAVFMRCSDELRRKIIGIFHRARLLDGIWCAKIIGRVLDRILELEDCDGAEASAQFIGSRIENAKIYFEDGNGENAIVQYSSARETIYEVMLA